MIVAPLMTPILGMVLSVGDRRRTKLCDFAAARRNGSLCRGRARVAAGTAHAGAGCRRYESQVAGRVDPTLGDLIAALATGAVGSFALVRDDVSDTLPGVAIAFSLVPPLAVVGLTL
jgi:uncharacterized membrane protein